jgi:DNA polymerase-3 subunit delta
MATPSAVLQQIASQTTAPVYLLFGEDDVEKAALAHEFEELVEEGLRAFNVERLHAGDWTTGDRLAAGVSGLVAAVRTLPMMAPRRVVLLLQADAVLMPKRESEAATRALEEFERLIVSPPAETTLVIVAGSVDKRGRVFKLLSKRAALVECGVLESAADAERWIRNRVAASGMAIAPAGARVLAERCGPDVKRLRNDVERLLLYAMGQKTIELADVREIVGPAALQDDWAMTNAIEAGDGATALRQLALMLDAGLAPEKILGQLGWLVRAKLPQIAPGRLRQAVESVFRTDIDLKRTAGDPRVLLERLVVELCERGGPKRPALRT